MARDRRQSGDGKLGCILWSLLLVVGGMIGWKAIPVKIASSELYDYMVEQAKFAQRSKPDALKERIYKKAREVNLPLDKRDIRVERRGDRILMGASFTVPLEFPGYVYYWDFDLEVDRPIFIF